MRRGSSSIPRTPGQTPSGFFFPGRRSRSWTCWRSSRQGPGAVRRTLCRRACSNHKIRPYDSGTIPCMKLAELASILAATCHGDPNQEITGVEGIEKAGPGQLTFVANPKYTPFARTTKAGAVLVTEDFEPIAT